jgi:hypothetical protein
MIVRDFPLMRPNIVFALAPKLVASLNMCQFEHLINLVGMSVVESLCQIPEFGTSQSVAPTCALMMHNWFLTPLDEGNLHDRQIIQTETLTTSDTTDTMQKLLLRQSNCLLCWSSKY